MQRPICLGWKSAIKRSSHECTREKPSANHYPKHASRGVGRALLAAAHDAPQAAGCAKRFFTQTSRTNER